MVPLWSFLFFGQANQQTAELLAGNQNLDEIKITLKMDQLLRSTKLHPTDVCR
jgi:hypothetical protein